MCGIYYGVFSGRTRGGEREVPRRLRQEDKWEYRGWSEKRG